MFECLKMKQNQLLGKPNYNQDATILLLLL